MIEGTTIEIGGKQYVLPPLGLAGLKMRDEILARTTDGDSTAQCEAMIEIAHAALLRIIPTLRSTR